MLELVPQKGKMLLKTLQQQVNRMFLEPHWQHSDNYMSGSAVLAFSAN